MAGGRTPFFLLMRLDNIVVGILWGVLITALDYLAWFLSGYPGIARASLSGLFLFPLLSVLIRFASQEYHNLTGDTLRGNQIHQIDGNAFKVSKIFRIDPSSPDKLYLQWLEKFKSSLYSSKIWSINL
ncbi:MAG: hypothetical protein ACXAE3_18000, partial [Candidatus Kariarchaeaceae archaeon]